jgi:hypothetical protein
MNVGPIRWAGFRNLAVLALAAVCAIVLINCENNNNPPAAMGTSTGMTAQEVKATCASTDNIETGLQGQTTLAQRMDGDAARGLNCNLKLIGQFQGEGAYHAQTWVDNCSYYSTADGATQAHPGVAVIDVTDPTQPVATAYLNSPSMLETWESLKMSTARHLLAAVESEGGEGTAPGFAVYDVSNCTAPVLDASIDLPIPAGTEIKGHAGAMAPDGMTYYGSTYLRSIYIIDISNPFNPTLLLNWVPPNGIGAPHDLSVSEDGNRLYVMQPQTSSYGVTIPASAQGKNGLVILDVSDFQSRKANPQVRVVSTLFWKDGGVAMTSEQIAIHGTPYLLVTDELQEGTRAAACANGTPVFGYARLINISDETNPTETSLLKLQVDDPANCAQLANDPAFVASEEGTSFGYSAHYCTADNRTDARLVACSRHEAGIRVFDVSNPTAPTEVAYYKPPIHTGANLPGSGINGVTDRTYDWNKSHSRFLNRNGVIELWTTSCDNGFQVLQFESNLTSSKPQLFVNVPTSLTTSTVP